MLVPVVPPRSNLLGVLAVVPVVVPGKLRKGEEGKC